MIFQAQRDAFFTVYIIKVTVSLTLFFVLPFILNQSSRNLVFVLVWSAIYLYFLITAVLTALRVKYILYDDYLYAKGGPFSKKIPYSKIYRVRSTPDVYSGDMLVTSGNAIEIFYTKGKARSIKISPKNPEDFIGLLQYHCPQAEVEWVDLSYKSGISD